MRGLHLQLHLLQLRAWYFCQEAGYAWQEGDVEWTPKSTLLYPAICSVAGLVAGMFGVGGGIVKIRSFLSSVAGGCFDFLKHAYAM